MPRSQGTSRKGKPKQHDRQAGMGRALLRAQQGTKTRQRKAGGGGMQMVPGMTSIGVEQQEEKETVSILEMNHVTDFLHQAEMAGQAFSSQREQFVVLDSVGQQVVLPQQTVVKWADQQENKKKLTDSFVFQELSVPRRPAWEPGMSKEEIQQRELDAFYAWRRQIAQQEEYAILHQSNTVGHFNSTSVTPYEKNVQIWRQLWHVLEACHVVVQLVDVRNPLFYLNHDLAKYIQQELNKPMILLCNKSDFCTASQRRAWLDYFRSHQEGTQVFFFSAHLQQKQLDQRALQVKRAAQQQQHAAPFFILPTDNEDDEEEEDDDDDDDDDEGEEEDDDNQETLESTNQPLDDNDAQPPTPAPNSGSSISYEFYAEDLLSRHDLLYEMQRVALNHYGSNHFGNNDDENATNDAMTFGMVGFPNVGKSSVLNVLMGTSKHEHGVVRVGVASRPGKTRHVQTLHVPPTMTPPTPTDNNSKSDNNDGTSHRIILYDCPGLVFPSLVSSTADLIAAGVYPISQMRDPIPVIDLICQRVPITLLSAHYGLDLSPKLLEHQLKEQQQQDQFGMAHLVLEAFCHARKYYMASSGYPDVQRAARIMIQDYTDGTLLYCHGPPTLSQQEDNQEANKFIRSQEEYQQATVENQLLKYKDNDKKLKRYQQESNRMQQQQQEEEEQDDDELVDFDLLNMLEEQDASSKQQKNVGKKKHGNMKRSKRKKKEHRHKDPYGCHSASNSGAGLVIKGAATRKRFTGGDTSYTRPMQSHYSGDRPKGMA